MPDRDYNLGNSDDFSEYINWRAEHPSDDLMTELLNAEFEDVEGKSRTLSGPRSSTTSVCWPVLVTRQRRDDRLDRQDPRRKPRPT